MSRPRGIVASGHPATSGAAADLLAAGGNAFDAALAALCAACVAEPMLASLGGGGFLMAQTAQGERLLHDFFVQTPGRKRPADEIDFHPVAVDFGTATQEFHVGMGSIAVPGVVAGLFAVHRRHGSLPMTDIVAPAVALARQGVVVTPLQHRIALILEPILSRSPAALRLVANRGAPNEIAPPGARVNNPALADLLEALAREGSDLFYRGSLAETLARDCADGGGLLHRADLEGYTAIPRKPLAHRAFGAECAFNPPPTPGGGLLAFALALLDDGTLEGTAWGAPAHCDAIVAAMAAAGRVRTAPGFNDDLETRFAHLLGADNLEEWRRGLYADNTFSRGTTHISVADAAGNLASLTVSNGEGSAYVLPGTGVMLNNMLGEQDLNPRGFHRWAEGRRLASMMCPGVARTGDGGLLALGSGGSNRIRSAVLQVLVNVLVFGQPLEDAVAAPRLHLEDDHLSVEAGFEEESVRGLVSAWPRHQVWPDRSIYFGGVHAVSRHADGRFEGAGEPRRGGAVVLA